MYTPVAPKNLVKSENVVYVVDASCSMTHSPIWDTAMAALKKEGVNNVLAVTYRDATITGTSKTGKELLDVLDSQGAPNNFAAEKLLNMYPDKNTKFVFIDDGDTMSALDDEGQDFLKNLQRQGHVVEVISINGRSRHFSLISFSGSLSLRGQAIKEKLSKLGIPFQAVPSDVAEVQKAISNAVQGKVKRPKRDTRPKAIQDAEKILRDRMDQLERRERSCEQSIEQLVEDRSRLNERLKTKRKDVRSIKAEFAKVEASLDALKVAKPTPKNKVKKTAAPKK